MYSEEFMAYLAAYQKEEKKPIKDEKPSFFMIWLTAILRMV